MRLPRLRHNLKLKGGKFVKKLAVLVALVTITLFFPVWLSGQQALSADQKILPDYITGNVGITGPIPLSTPVKSPTSR